MSTKIQTIVKDGINVAQATKTGYIFCPEGGIFDSSYPKSLLRRGRVQGNGQISPTITCSPTSLWIVDTVSDKNLKLRTLTERECFRLMGLRDDEIDKIKETDISKTGLYKIAGNSIVVDVLTEIFRTMFIEPNSEIGQSDALF